MSQDRVHLFGIRHHGPGSAALLRAALSAVDPACVLIEGPPEGDALIPYVAAAGMKPPLAMLLHATGEEKAAMFMPFAEFSPEWQAMLWATERGRPVRFIDWPAAVSLAANKDKDKEKDKDEAAGPRGDALDLLAGAAGYEDGEAFWNGLIEQHRSAAGALGVFRAIEAAMTEARAAEGAARRSDLQREAFMRGNVRAALKEFVGPVAVVCGAWHLSALREATKPAEDKAMVKDLARIKVEATWVPWTDSRLSAYSGYGAGVISPGWYRHLWGLYARAEMPPPEEFTAVWQARTASLLRAEGYGAPTASAIEATRLALALAALRALPMPGLAEMREAALATLCHGNEVALGMIERKLYVGERVGEIDASVPQMPLARDLALWQKKVRLKPEDRELEVKLDLRSDAGSLKSTLLHRLNLIGVRWGRLLDAQSGRGTFREVWGLRWVPELSVALAEALIWGVTIETAAANATLERAAKTTSVTLLAELVQGALIADLPDAARAAIGFLQAAAVGASDMTDLMLAVLPLVKLLRYGSARELPEDALRALVLSLSVEVNAGVRLGSRALDDAGAAARVAAMEGFDEALSLFGDEALLRPWRAEMGRMVEDDQVAAAVAGYGLRRLHDVRDWELEAVAGAFARHTGGRERVHAGAFLEGFLRGGSEVLLQDEPLLRLMDAWLAALGEAEFMESLPLLRRSLGAFDAGARRRLLETVRRGGRESGPVRVQTEANPAFEAALPLLLRILGMEPGQGAWKQMI